MPDGINSTATATAPSSTSPTSGASATSTPLIRFLRRVWHLSEAEPWFCYWLRGPDGDWRVKPGDDLEGIAAEISQQIGDFYYSPHSYLPRGGRNAENIVQFHALVIDLDGADLEEALSNLRRIGVVPHFVVGTSPARWQLVILLNPIRTGKNNRQAILKRLGVAVWELYGLAGGDPNAANINQLFRLPGSRRQLSDGVWDVNLWAENTHLPYSLAYLERALKRAHRKQNRARLIKFELSHGDHIVAGPVWDSPAIRWLRENTIAQGFRNTALVAMCYAAAMGGVDYERARPLLLEWVQERTEGPYPTREAEAVIRSCFNNPKGLDPHKLMIIENTNGETMGQARAISVLRYMPKQRPRYARKPATELKKKPLFQSIMAVLWEIARRQRNRKHPAMITDHELAQAAGIPLGTLYRMKPLLRGWGIVRRIRVGRSFITLYDLTKLPRSPNILSTFVEWTPAWGRLFRRNLQNVLKYWAWRFPVAWNAFIKGLIAIMRLFTNGGSGGSMGSGEGVQRLGVTRERPRGPPPRDVRGVIVGLSQAFSYTPVAPGMSRERELERWENRSRLLREWAQLPQEEIARRIEARREIARKWQEERR